MRRGCGVRLRRGFLAERGTGTFCSIDDLTARVPGLNRKELVTLARISALNRLGNAQHRRDALRQVEEAGRTAGLLPNNSGAKDVSASVPLRQMTTDERLVADFAGTGLTTGPHPMAYHRQSLRSQGILAAEELIDGNNHQIV